MSRTLRGAWSRRWTLLPLLLLTLIVVAGTVTVIVFAQAADTSAVLVAPLLVLGLVAVPSTARELAEARRAEIGLARLRGVQGGELSALASTEPLLVLVLGGLLGLGVGDLSGRLAVRLLAPAAEPRGAGLAAVEAGLAIVVVGLVAVVAAMTRALGEPLSEQVRSARRPRPAGALGVFGLVLLLVGAVVASYRASVSGNEPDALVLAGPALVGLAVGQLVVWAVQLLASALVRPSRKGGLAGFLAVRRLARVADVATPLRLVVAAATVATLAATGATQVASWADETSRLRAGGPQQVLLDATAGEALSLTRELDPDGRYLMAAVLVPGTGSVPARRAYLDLSRFDAVLGDFYAGTPVEPVVGRMHDLINAGMTSDGDTLEVGVRGVSSRTSGPISPVVTVAYVDSTGASAYAQLSLSIGLDGREATGSAPLPGCSAGCTIAMVSAGRTPGDSTLPWVIDRLDFGGVDALALDWRPGEEDTGARVGGLLQVDDGLLVRTATGVLQGLPDIGTLPVLATTSATWEGRPGAQSPGGDDRDAQVLGRAAALPLVEADGLLLDLPTADVGAAPTVPIAEVSVLAAADTPTAVLDRLSARADSAVRTLAEVKEQTTLQSGATQAGVYAVMAGACLLAALLALATAFSRQRASWRRDLAALRVIGVPARVLVATARREVLILAVAAALGTAVGGVLAVRLLLSHLALVSVPDHAVALVTSVAPGPTVAGALAAAVVVGVVVGRGRSVAARRSRPAILREEGVA